MNHPSNTTSKDWKNGMNYDYNSDESFWYLINYQIDGRNEMDKEWGRTCSNEYRVKGETLESIIREKYGWKTGDIKNGIKGIKVNGFLRNGKTESSKDLEFQDTKRILTRDADGMSITINNKIFIISNF